MVHSISVVSINRNRFMSVAIFVYCVIMGYVIYVQLSICNKQREPFDYEPTYIEYVLYDSKNASSTNDMRTIKIPAVLSVMDIQERLNLYGKIVKKYINDPYQYVVHLCTNNLFATAIYNENINTNHFMRCIVFDERNSKKNYISFVRTNKKNGFHCSQGVISIFDHMVSEEHKSNTYVDDEQLQFHNILFGFNSYHHKGITFVCNIDVLSLLDMYITDPIRIKNYENLILYTETVTSKTVENRRYIGKLSAFELVETVFIIDVPSIWVYKRKS